MSSEWSRGKLGDFIELKRGYDLPKAKRETGSVPLVSSSGVSDMHNVAMAKGPGVVTGRYGTIGQVFYVAEDFWPLNTTLYVRDFKGNDPKFIHYFLKTLDFLAYSDKAAVPGVNRNHLHEALVVVPPPSVQLEIASLLGALDDRITLLRETNATLEAIAQALFKSWFVDFDPVRAKSEGRTPEGLDEATAALFPDSFEAPALGLVPKGWHMAPLAEAFEMNPARKLKKGVAAPYLDMASVSTQGHVVEGAIEREMGSGTKFINGDTLLARITPCLENGKTAFVDFLNEEQTGWGSTEFVVLRPKAPLPEYLGYLLCRHSAFREHAIQSMSGTSGRQRVQNDVLGRYPVAVPPEPIAMEFSQVVSALQKKIAGNHRQAQTLATLRDTLLPRLISGQLRLPESAEPFELASAVLND
jgi:type I restriction enzyme, S subunit